MNSIVFREIVKEAVFGLEQAKKVGKIFRQNEIPKDKFVPGEMRNTYFGMSKHPAGGISKKEYNDMLESFHGKRGKGFVRAPDKGYATRTIRGFGINTSETAQKSMPLSQHKMLEGIVRNHELNEVRMKPKGGMRTIMGWAHNSPDVIFADNNMTRSLSNEFNPVRNIMKEMRAPETEIIQRYFPDFRFGEQRLSRGMRRRMADIIEKGEESRIRREWGLE